MDTLLLPMHSWDTINTMCFNRKALVVGVGDGSEVISVAQSAAITAVYVSSDSAGLGRQLSTVAMLDDLLTTAHLTSRVLLHGVCALLGITQYHTGQFDVVIYNPDTAGSDQIEGDLVMLANAAASLVVIDDPNDSRWDTVTAALAGTDRQCMGDGAIIWATPMPAAPESTVA